MPRGAACRACASCISGTGRDGEWARLVEAGHPRVHRPGHRRPATRPRRPVEPHHQLPGPAGQGSRGTGLPPPRLQHTLITWDRDRAAAALASPRRQDSPPSSAARSAPSASPWKTSATSSASKTIRAACLYYEEALTLCQRISARTDEANLANTLGNTYKNVPGLRDLGQAERWYPAQPHPTGPTVTPLAAPKPASLGNSGLRAVRRSPRRRVNPGRCSWPTSTPPWDRYQQALALFPADDAEDLAAAHNQLGLIYDEARDTRSGPAPLPATTPLQGGPRRHHGAGTTRYNIALLLQDASRRADALLYARAALSDFEKVGPGAAQVVARAQNLITRLEHDSG